MSTAGAAGGSLGESIRDMVNFDFLSSCLCRETFPLLLSLYPCWMWPRDILSWITLLPLGKLQTVDQGCCSLRGSRVGAHRAAGHSSKRLEVEREPLYSIWGSLGYKPLSQVTLRW